MEFEVEALAHPTGQFRRRNSGFGRPQFLQILPHLRRQFMGLVGTAFVRQEPGPALLLELLLRQTVWRRLP